MFSTLGMPRLKIKTVILGTLEKWVVKIVPECVCLVNVCVCVYMPGSSTEYQGQVTRIKNFKVKPRVKQKNVCVCKQRKKA